MSKLRKKIEEIILQNVNNDTQRLNINQQIDMAFNRFSFSFKHIESVDRKLVEDYGNKLYEISKKHAVNAICEGISQSKILESDYDNKGYQIDYIFNVNTFL